MQFIQDFAGFVSYFRTLAANTTYFKYFEQGGTEKIVSERLLSDLRSKVDYPLFFLEWPFLHLSDYGASNTQTEFKAAFVVLENPEKDNWQAQDVAMNRTHLAVLQVLGQMRIDTTGLNKKFFAFDLSQVNIDPLDNMLIDQAYGWRCEFMVVSPLNISSQPYCRDPQFWK